MIDPGGTGGRPVAVALALNGTALVATILAYVLFGPVYGLVAWSLSVFSVELILQLWQPEEYTHGNATAPLMWIAMISGIGIGISLGTIFFADFLTSGGLVGFALWYVMFGGGGLVGGAILYGVPALSADLIIGLTHREPR